MIAKKIVLIVSILSVILTSLPASAGGPYKLKSRGEAAAVGTSLCLISFMVLLEKVVLTEEEIAALSPEDINGFDRPATGNWSPHAADLSDIGVTLLTAAPAAFLLKANMRKDAGTLCLMYGESYLLTRSITGSVKKAVSRTRPFVYNPEAPLNQKKTQHARQSMFSGHTADSFNAAVFFSTVYSDYHPQSRWKPYVWGASLAGASTVGYLRIRAGKHFPTDVIVGALVGSATGYLVPRIHRKQSPVSVYPITNPGAGVSVSVSW